MTHSFNTSWDIDSLSDVYILPNNSSNLEIALYHKFDIFNTPTV